MVFAIIFAAAFAGLALASHLVSILVAMIRCRRLARPHPRPRSAAGVTLVRPVCGIDNFVDETLRSSFTLDYPRYEVIFCVANAKDPVIAIVRQLIAEHPDVPARLLIGDERISTNPKLNNCVKGWAAAAYDWIVLADSNVLMPSDYIQRLFAAWRPDTGLVCSPPIGSRPEGFWAQVECAFLNTYQARWQYFAASIGLGFAQGKTMMWWRDLLERAGGIRRLATEVAEDAASTKVVRAAGLHVRVVDPPFEQPLGARSARDVWNRQIRWARLRRASFMLYFAPELVSGAALPLLAVAVVAAGLGWSIPAALLLFGVVWYGAEVLLAHVAGWPVTRLYPLHALTRDLLIPLLWADAWRNNGFVWRGNQMSVDDDALPADLTAAD
ncbi:MAG: glycosyltransferase [Bradyrhizobiaceae bacterium]|nr:glycosyltransferase [Bradyrhizobiaceae bacterium]